MTRALVALIVVTAGSAVAVTTKHAHHTGTVLGRVVSREPELRPSRSFRRPPLPGRAHHARVRDRQRWHAHNWAAVAQCESSGHWDDNTGNGFYGGLQFTLSTWRAYGGHGWPQDATPAEQIRVAERVLVGQGIGAWPTCGHHLWDAT